MHMRMRLPAAATGPAHTHPLVLANSQKMARTVTIASYSGAEQELCCGRRRPWSAACDVAEDSEESSVEHLVVERRKCSFFIPDGPASGSQPECMRCTSRRCKHVRRLSSSGARVRSAPSLATAVQIALILSKCSKRTGGESAEACNMHCSILCLQVQRIHIWMAIFMHIYASRSNQLLHLQLQLQAAVLRAYAYACIHMHAHVIFACCH